ncbi:aldehyde dehydrogenase family 16 member a1-like [Plakobranchus ocellatus]|uniref:Aldehyde dehydrogenase family 16 member a1-like n=1 Tax=Plakobranchus ocellatus TaxID=259542 RepID=A0AAV3YCE1_9GAST|nr:aldehyde dehydrogenase family 16 member a1-like [Plakobranchus ocellatus]
MAGAVAQFPFGSLLETLDYGPAVEGETVVGKWLDKHNRNFGHFISGEWQRPVDRDNVLSKKPSTGETLATTIEANEDDVQRAVLAAEEAYKKWRTLSPFSRAKYLYSWKSPLIQLAQRVAPALAAGNSVVVMPSSHTCLSTLLFADICAQVGLPHGVFNVVTGSTPGLLASHPSVDVVTLAGNTLEGRAMRQLIAGSGKKLSLALSGHCPILVFEEADLDSAVEGIVEGAFSNSGQNTYSASRLLVQEPVYTQLIEKLKARMAKLTMGNNLDKNKDQGPLCDAGAVIRLGQLVQEALAEGAQIFQPVAVPSGVHDCFPPTLITGAQTSSQIYLEEPCGPVLVAVPFRTEKEAITIANHSVSGTAAGVWTENISVAMEVASLLQVATVWINTYGLLDAACEAGGYKASGFGRTGGKESLYSYMHPSWQPLVRTTNSEVDLDKFGASSNSDLLPNVTSIDALGTGDHPNIDKTYKLFYGGGQKRPDSGATHAVVSSTGEVIGYVPDGGKKDIRNAVEAALKSAPGWGRKDGHGRSQILYYLAENLLSRKADFVSLLTSLGGEGSEERAQAEVDLAMERLFHWAALCDKFGGTVQESTLYGQTWRIHSPLGVIGIVCPDDFPFLGFISLIAPAIARGNTVVAVPSGQFPLAALAFHQVLETSDVPAGVVNIITGDRKVLTRTLAQHQDVASIWYFGADEAGSTFVEAASSGGNMKRTWVNYGRHRNFAITQQGQGNDFLVEATTVKTIWCPMGDIFAN